MSTVDYTPADAPRRFRREKPVAVLGGGPAGLTAGYLLAKEGRPVIVFEAEDQVRVANGAGAEILVFDLPR